MFRVIQLSAILGIASGTMLLGASLLLVPAPTAADVVATPASHRLGLLPGYDYPTLDVPTFVEKSQGIREAYFLESKMQATAAQQLNELVFQTIAHSDQLRLQWADNWLLAAGALVYEPLSEPQLPEQVLRQQQGLCSDACKVLQNELKKLGIISAYLGLGGHVVLLVRCDEWTYWADPDFGVFAQIPEQQTLPDWTVLETQLQDRGFPQEMLANYREILEQSQQHVLLDWDQPLSPRLTLIARVAEYLVWIGPLAMILGGLYFLNRRPLRS